MRGCWKTGEVRSWAWGGLDDVDAAARSGMRKEEGAEEEEVLMVRLTKMSEMSGAAAAGMVGGLLLLPEMGCWSGFAALERKGRRRWR